MIGNSTLSFAGQSIVSPSRHQYSSPYKSGDNMKNLLTQGGGYDQINNSPTRFKQKQPLSQYDYYYSQNPTNQTDYAKMLDAQIEQKRQYQNLQQENQRNDRNLGKVNNINPHFIPESAIAPNYGFQSGLKTVGSNFGQNSQMQATGNYSTVFNPKIELQRTQPGGRNIFELQQQQYGQNQLRLTSQQNTSLPLRLSQSQINLKAINHPYLSNSSSYNQPSLLNSMHMQQTVQGDGGNPLLKKSVNFNMMQNNPQMGYGQIPIAAQRPIPKAEDVRETFFEKWSGQNNYNENKPQNFRGILKKENMSEMQIQDKERKQQELSYALQEQILYKKKRQEIEERQQKLEDLVYAEKLRADQRGERNSQQLPSSQMDNMQIKAVAAQADRLQQRNLASRKLESQSKNKSNFDDIKELPRTPPNMSHRSSVNEGPIVRIEKIIDFSSNRAKAPSPRNRRSSGGMLQQSLVLSEVKEAAELDMDYIKDYYEFQKKVFSREMATLQKEVSGVNDQRTQVFKDMLLLREKSKQEHLMNLMRPKDVLDDNKYITAQRKQNLYNFHQLEDIKSLYGGGNPYLQGIQYLPTDGFNFQNYYDDKQFTQLVNQSQLVPPAELIKNKAKKKKKVNNDNYDHSEQIIGEMRRKLEQQDMINRQKPLSAGSKPNQIAREDSFFRDISKAKGFDANKKNNNKDDNNKNIPSKNEFLENEDEFEESMGGVILTENANKNQRPSSSKNFKDACINIEQFRREMFPNKRLEFEVVKEQQKEQQSYIEQYIWEMMSQDSEEHDELDEKIDECMDDIERMVNREGLNNPVRVEDRKLSEIEMQRKMKAFLKGKELQEEHLQLLLREQAKEKLRQIERQLQVLNYQQNNDNDNQNQPKIIQSIHLSHVSLSNQKQRNNPTLEVLPPNNPNQESVNNGQDLQNQKNSSQSNLSQKEDQGDLEQRGDAGQQKVIEEEDNEKKIEEKIEKGNEEEQDKGSNQVVDLGKKAYKMNDIAKIQETDESGVSERYDEKYNMSNDQIKIETEETTKVLNTQHKEQIEKYNNKKKTVDQNKLQNLYQDIIQKNSRQHDTNLFEKSLNNIDDMLMYFRETGQAKSMLQ